MPKTREELLKISKNTQFRTGKKQVATARAGGIASGIAKREKKTMKEMLDYLLEKVNKDESGDIKSNKELMLATAVSKAVKGDLASLIFIRDTIGEKPVDKGIKVEINNNMPDASEIKDVLVEIAKEYD